VGDTTARGVFGFTLRGKTVELDALFRIKKLSLVLANPPDNESRINLWYFAKHDRRKIIQTALSQSHGCSASSYPTRQHSSASMYQSELPSADRP
jgi:hypothetical protein